MNETTRGLQVLVHLEDGTPEGLQTIRVGTWDIRATVCSRTRFPSARKLDSFHRPGVYLLEGESEPLSQRPRIYIGEADLLAQRITSHLRGYDFWRRAIAFSRTEPPLTQTDVKYVESRLVERARQASRAEIVNKVVPRHPRVSRADEDDDETFFERILTILPVVGIRAFELPRLAPATRGSSSLAGVPLFYHERGSSAEGRATDEGFAMLKGGQGRAALLPAAPAWIRELRAKLLTSGVLEQEGEALHLTRDHVFGSSSTAAAVLVGGTVPGPIRWKTKDGMTLKDLEAASLSESP